MPGFFEKLRSFFSRREAHDASGLSDAELQAEFRKRYHNFKLLLTANTEALRIMSDMERALRERRTFGMSFVRSQATAATVNVFRIVSGLREIAPGKYDELAARLTSIQKALDHVLTQSHAEPGPELVLPLERVDLSLSDQVGAKMAALGEIVQTLGLPVPPGFIVTARGYKRMIEHNGLGEEISRILQAAGEPGPETALAVSASVRQKILNAQVPPELALAVMDAYAALEAKAGPGVRVSLRSSALGEDAAGQSFAGQFSSKLNVAADSILEAYKEVVASKYSPQAMAYRLAKGIPDEFIAMCVGCMVMVKAACGGVVYSKNPLNVRDDSIIVHAALGLPATVVDGAAQSDEFTVARAPALHLAKSAVRLKSTRLDCDAGEGVRTRTSPGEQAAQPALTEAQILALAAAALKLEAHYGGALDIEWAIDEAGALFILQCRALVQTEASNAGERENAGRFGAALAQGGVAASPGVAAGVVHHVRRDADLLGFPDRGILVSPQARPRWASVIGKCAGIVAESGGAAGHLANVAREFGVPALLSLPGAMDALGQGQEVTLDADGLAVYPGLVEELLALAAPREDARAFSPMHAMLRRVMDLIVPLHLLDPAAMEFSPKNCRTLHDITRFCHEKSVIEMFNFGQDFQFSKRAAKQLKHRVPMKWWLINLDDGFTHDVKGKYVQLDEIASIPMLALWRGMTAVPWAGPPPVDAKGFMSILGQAASNPQLEAAARSDYAELNYFMVSKHFLSLSSRFGFHFSTIEALVDERARENYVSFQFKGGAAEFSRRRRRAEMIGHILDLYGFQVEIKEDAMFARLIQGGMDYLLERIGILGYLLIHTRQLDMIMGNEARALQYQDKMLKDIRTAIAAPGENRRRPKVTHPDGHISRAPGTGEAREE
ncbi:MAG: pyruvate, water dikinase [Desulfovibrionaceae bacterium]|nr:pyruvate, water dikinase [Desulfovibrionaceae bacterium]MBF0513868.1 pyruvate, water dikinase [Desulfovibrionaceae bacterium]